MATANEPPPSPEWSAPDSDYSYDSNGSVYTPAKLGLYVRPSKEQLREDEQERADWSDSSDSHLSDLYSSYESYSTASAEQPDTLDRQAD